MKKRILSILLISLALVGTVTTTKSNVKADSFNYYSTGKGFTHLKHKVVLIKPITIRKVHFYGHTFYTYLKEKKTLPAGTQIKILPYGDKGYYWLVFYGNKDTTRWVYPQKKTDWFDTYAKHIYIDYGLFHGAKKRVEKSYTFTWKQYCKLVKMGMYTLMYHPYGSTHNKIMKQIKAWNLTAD